MKKCIEQYRPLSSPFLRCSLLRALSSLRKDDSIVILPADKGNATVVMDREDYRQKAHEILDDRYQVCKKDPRAKLERRIHEQLKTL